MKKDDGRKNNHGTKGNRGGGRPPLPPEESLGSSDKKKKTSAAVKNRWNAAHYDKIIITAPKGWKATVKEAADKENKSLAGYIREAVEEKNRE